MRILLSSATVRAIEPLLRPMRYTALGCALLLAGCGASLTAWIVSTRDHQGDLALDSRRFKEAAMAYHLALQIDPNDARARAGYVESEASVAEGLYMDSEFDEALKELESAEQVDSQSVRIEGLRSDIENARLKRQIVLSNYPEFASTKTSIERSYVALRTENTEIVTLIKRFGYTYDTAELTTAIRNSYDLATTVSKLTSRLANLRTMVSAGSVSTETGAGTLSSGSASLLPLP